jgi:hypothetical protein
MKAIVKLTILALSAIYCLAGFAILSPLISAITRNAIFLSIGLLFALLFFMSTFAISRGISIQWKGIFVRLEERGNGENMAILTQPFHVHYNLDFSDYRSLFINGSFVLD